MSRVEHHEAEGLDTGHLRRVQIVALALVSYTPAVALATVPFLLVVGAGHGSWLGALIGAVGIGCVGVAVVTFARRFVVTGTLYSYIDHVFGPWARVVMGSSLLLGYVALIAGVSMTSGIFAGSFLVAAGFESGLNAGPMAVTTTVAMVVAAALAYRGLDTSVRTAVILTVLTLPITVVVTVAVAAHTGLALPAQLRLDGSTFGGIVNGVAAAAVFLVAFESSAALAAETRDPKRNVPLAVMSVPVVLGGCYLLATLLQVPGLMAASDALAAGMSPPAALAVQAGLGQGLAMMTDAALAVANVASLIAFVNYGSRFVATLATDELVPRRLAGVHPRHLSPAAAIVVLSVVAQLVLLVLLAVWPDHLVTGVLPSISTLTVYLWLIPYVLICIGAIVLAARERALTPTLAVSAPAGAAAMVWVYVNALVNPPPAPVSWMAVIFAVTVALVVLALGVRERTARATVETE
ncbi:APC family permease [Pseudonocardia eucalypti]|uniref:APC family permease n=1 Tax=Pseudonocardia eucalypti TaxID=648755 RepID=A0ABP9QII9_9PSEU|nr:amino acid transporter [Pseudonocardia eucalypti]